MIALIIIGCFLGYILIGTLVAYGEMKASDRIGVFSHDINSDPYSMAWVAAFWPAFLVLGIFITPWLIIKILDDRKR